MKQFRHMYNGKPVFSIEIFPPKTELGEHTLFSELRHLVSHLPAFVSVTYGAGGSTRAKTMQLVKEIRARLNVTTVPHFTSVGARPQDVRDFVDEAVSLGARNMVALRGDLPRGATNYEPPPDGFRYGSELIEFIADYTQELDLAVAGYPEGHVECRDIRQDVQYLKRKVDAGAVVILTQLFYDNADFFRFRDEAARQGIAVPIVPGIMPITKFSQIQRITALCGARIPDELMAALTKYGDGSTEQQAAGIEYAVRQCRELLDGGAPGLHLFTLNSGHATSRIVHALRSYFDWIFDEVYGPLKRPAEVTAVTGGS